MGRIDHRPGAVRQPAHWYRPAPSGAAGAAVRCFACGYATNGARVPVKAEWLQVCGFCADELAGLRPLSARVLRAVETRGTR
jgi:hypothetical protein